MSQTVDATVLATHSPAGPPARALPNARIKLGSGVMFASVAEVFAVAEAFAKGKVGAADDTMGMIAAKIIKGQTLGLDPVTSLGNIIVVRGRTTLMGDLALALLRRHELIGTKFGGAWEEKFLGTEGENDWRCEITATRADSGDTMTRSFSVKEAKRAGLIPDKLKDGDVWKGYLDRMLRYRALGFICRDLFGDILLGLHIFEETQGGEFFDPGKPSHPTTETPAEPALDPFFLPVEPKALKAAQAAKPLDGGWDDLVTVPASEPVPAQEARPAKDASQAVQATDPALEAPRPPAGPSKAELRESLAALAAEVAPAASKEATDDPFADTREALGSTPIAGPAAAPRPEPAKRTPARRAPAATSKPATQSSFGEDSKW